MDRRWHRFSAAVLVSLGLAACSESSMSRRGSILSDGSMPTEAGSDATVATADSGSDATVATADSGSDATVAIGDAGSDADVGVPTGDPSALTSIEFGRTLHGADYAVRDDVPAGGTLFSIWTHSPDPVPQAGETHTGHNLDAYVLYGDNWHMRCLTGNISVLEPNGTAWYNANSMLFAGPQGTWIDDFSFYIQPAPSVEAAFGWVWGAWLIVIESDHFVIRQWLKFGIDGPVIAAGESAPTFAALRQTLVTQRGWTQAAADDWVPADATHFQVGKDHGYLVQARMMATASSPTLDTLDAWARATTGDGTAWADYRLGWVGGAPDLADRSGHGRDLRIESGGTLHQGVAAPAF